MSKHDHKRNIMKKALCCIICLLILVCPILTGCGDSSTVTQDGITYKKVTVHSDGESTECYYVVGCDSTIKKLKIASKVNGLPVLGFEANAFRGNTRLKEVTIPDTITSISSNGAPFNGCTNIEKLTLATCDVEKLFKPFGSGDVNNIDPVPASLKYIYLTNACTKISASSFRYCRYLKEVHIPASVTDIDDGTNRVSVGVNGNSADNNKFEYLPFLGCENLTVHCEAKSAPDGWGSYWNYIDSQTQASVVWNSYGSSQGSGNTNITPNTEYKLLATLDKNSTVASYGNDTKINFSNTGSITVFSNNNSTNPGFRWSLGEYDFSIYSEYKLVFDNLRISGADSSVTYEGADSITSLRLNWSDSTYGFSRYYNTDTRYFDTSLNNYKRFLSLDSLSYNSYSVDFKFNHYNIATATSKNLYFDFTGVEAGGSITFDSLSIYYI